MYTYQAFFSYKRDPLTDPWHEEVVIRLSYWIGQSLQTLKPRIFLDRRSIDNGADFEDFIAGALMESAIITSIFSPLYFVSQYCMSEINAFLQREQALGLTRGRLVASARFHDGDNYPPPFNKMEAIDFSTYANPSPFFWRSEKGEQFEDIIKAFAKIAADKIKGAPVLTQKAEPELVRSEEVASPIKIRRPGEYLTEPPLE